MWPIDCILTGTAISGQSGLGSNDNKELFHIAQISRTEASLPEAI